MGRLRDWHSDNAAAIWAIVFIVAFLGGLVAVVTWAAYADKQALVEKELKHEIDRYTANREEFEREVIAHGAGTYVQGPPGTGPAKFQWKDRRNGN